MTGLFHTGRSSFGIVLVIGSILVPSHATIITAFIMTKKDKYICQLPYIFAFKNKVEN